MLLGRELYLWQEYYLIKMYKLEINQSYADLSHSYSEAYNPYVIDQQLHSTPRLVEKELSYQDYIELSILQRQIKFADVLKSKTIEDQKTVFNCQNTAVDLENKLYHQNNHPSNLFEFELKEDTVAPNKGKWNSSEFFFCDNSNNNIEDYSFHNKNGLRLNFNDDADSLNYENCFYLKQNFDDNDELAQANNLKSESKNSKRTNLENKLNLSRTRSKQKTIREDVMNKNILRAIRREWKNLFTSFCSSYNIKIKKQSKCYLNIIKDFAHYLIRRQSSSEVKDSFLNKVLDSTVYNWEESDFVVYLGIFTDYWAMKRILEESSHRLKLFKINEVLYNFTQTKFYEFIFTPEVNAIIKLICNVAGTESLISKNDALVDHQGDYVSHITKLFIHQKDFEEKA